MEDAGVPTNLVYSDPDAVFDRLAQLGLREDLLCEALLQAHLHRSRLTRNHPRIFFGLEMWGWSVASLREQLAPLGWLAADLGNFPLTVNEALGIAIAIASGDEATGNSLETPSNRSRKGRNTVDAVEMNRQADMFAEFLPQSRKEPEAKDTWVLLHFSDTVKRELRMELSRPSDIGDDGRITTWTERIILGSLPLDGDSVEIMPPSGPDIDIDIRRKG